MSMRPEVIKLYAITDRSWLGKRELEGDVEQALRGGVTCIQLREKTLPDEDFLRQAIIMRKLCDKYSVPLIINDNVDIALRCGADGVHVGGRDMHPQKARKILGPDRIVGVSARTVEAALAAADAGADYLGCGAVFTTSTKTDAARLSHETLRRIKQAVKIPVCAIGGINENNICLLRGSNIDGVAVISAIFAKDDICAAAADLRRIADEGF